MLRQESRIERDAACAIRERIHAASQRDHLALLRPARKLQQDGRSPIGKCLHEQWQIETRQVADEIGEGVVFHKRYIS